MTKGLSVEIVTIANVMNLVGKEFANGEAANTYKSPPPPPLPPPPLQTNTHIQTHAYTHRHTQTHTRILTYMHGKG